MPLDVQPLSPLRRIIMVLAMLALLGTSLGFAQWLIIGRQASVRHTLPARVFVRFLPPEGLVNLPVNASAEQVQTGDLVEGLVEFPPLRHLHAFSFQNTTGIPAQEFLLVILDRVLPDPNGLPVSFRGAVLGEQGALEVERHIDSSFAIIRLTSVEDHIVAFCFSGDGRITDADRQFFDHYCLTQVQITTEDSSRKG